MAAVMVIAGTQNIFSQCNTTNATSCQCLVSTQTDCDLLPDMKVARPPLLVQGTSGVIEYSQSGNGANNGRLRISVSTPNVGFGPLEIRTTNIYVCGTDTFTGTPPSICPDNVTYPRQLINQRVYHKNGNAMSYYDRAAGTMTYHPTHGHMHVDNWGNYSLRTATADPNPLNWPIVGTGAKLAFCLMDYGSCSTYNGHCTDDNNSVLVNSNFPNFGLGGGAYNCSPVVQGISSGYTDIYYQSLDGMWITIPPGTCNGQYQIVVHLDPYNYFLESNEGNNVIAVPFTLTQQSGQIPVITPSGSTSLCPGSSITLTSNAATTYSWSTGATTQSIVVNTAGQYSVVTTSGNNCVGTSQPVTISINPMTVAASASASAICQGESVNLSATVSPVQYTNVPLNFSNTGSYSIPDNNPTGVSSPVTASGINPAAIISSTMVSVTLNISHTYDGDLIIYLVAPSGNQIKLSNRRGGSGDNFTNTVFSPSATLPIANGSAPFNNTYLPDESFSLLTGNANGTWQLKVVDADPTDIGTINNWTLRLNNQVQNTNSFSWTSSPAGFTSSVSNPVASPSANTSYTVMATDNSTGCMASSSVAVSVNLLPQVTISNPQPICAGNSVTLTAGGADTYEWSPATGLSATTGSSVDASPSSTTTYTVTGTTNGCTSTQTATVTVYTSLSLTISSPATICSGGSTTLTASGADTYLWSPSAGLDATTGSSVQASPAGTTLYTVTGTAGGCTGTASVQVTVNSVPVISISPSSPSICTGQSTVLTASGAGVYGWSPATGLNTTSGTAVTASPASTTQYTVTGTGNGCSGTAEATVTVNPLPVVSIGGLSASYPVNSNAATVSGNPPGGTLSGTGISGNTFTPCVAGTGGPYSITYSYTDANGCSNTASQNVSVTGLASYNCIVPFCQSVSNITSTSARVAWSSLVVSNKFRVRYKLTTASNYSYKNVNGSLSSVVLTNLLPNKTYQWAVQSQCGNNSSGYSATATFTTLPSGQRVESTSANAINIFPSIADELITVDFNSAEDVAFMVYIFDVTGKKHSEVETEFNEGENQFTIGTEKLAAGMYVLLVTGGVETYWGKFIVKH